MSKLILGLDGGATKSHIALFNENGNCVSTTTYGPLNHEVMKGSYAELEERLGELLPRAVKEAGATLDDIKHAVLGVAGVDTNAQFELISGMIGKIGFKDYIVCNDAVLGVAAGCPKCVGVCAINGTGFKLAAIDNSGVTVETCGLGNFTDDLGGGYWYGHRAICSVYNEIYKLGRPTIMKEMVYDLFEITRREDYLEVLNEKFYSDEIDSVSINSIAFNAAALGDAVAIGILEASAEQYAGAIARLLMDFDFPADQTAYVTLAGSVFVKQKVKLLQDFIRMRVDDALNGRSVEYITLDAPPVAGAVMWAAQKASFDIEMPAIKAGLEAAGL
ncbi:MAG: hypothetical protein FWD38_06090 [Oscillospiraceae bacterium]|nr:hypothetical protein [Oscillospiraceae bacterium]